MSILASILILFALFVKALTRQRIKVQIQYAIWLLILIRLIIPALPKSAFSILNVVPVAFNRPPVISAVDNFNYDQCLTEILDEKATEDVQGYKNYLYLNPAIISDSLLIPISAIRITFVIWFCGAIAGNLYLIISYIGCLIKVNSYKPIKDKRIMDILEECKNDMNIKKHISILQVQDINSPAIFSLLKPRILIPLDIIKNVSEDDIKNIFLHELSHYKRKDIFVNYIVKIVKLLHWFNPLIWYFTKALKRDMELCCDSLALSYLHTSKLKQYGYTMIDIIKYSKHSKKTRLNMAVGISLNVQDMTRRMKLIKDFKQNSGRTIMITRFILLVIAAIMLTEANTNSVFLNHALLNNKAITSKYIVDEFGRNRIVDNVNYPYICDSKVIGSWVSVDCVDYVSEFKKDKKFWKGNLFIKKLNFFEDGTTDKNWLTWTKGLIIDKDEKLSSEYTIKDIDGEIYMFLQWKGGDYAFGCRKPIYYVLKKVK
jgi:bla regulator protein BlaR1